MWRKVEQAIGKKKKKKNSNGEKKEERALLCKTAVLYEGCSLYQYLPMRRKPDSVTTEGFQRPLAQAASILPDRSAGKGTRMVRRVAKVFIVREKGTLG